MGCLNSKGQFNHYFSNIHMSGPCNRSCYFCIGQHMMTLDPLNNLHQWPLLGLDKFIQELNVKGINEVNVTGSNTDPLLATNLHKLKRYLSEQIPDLLFGVRTNGVAILSNPERWALFNKASISLTSFNTRIYKATMGQGQPPNLAKIKELCNNGIGPSWDKIKINIVLCPELLEENDILRTINELNQLGIARINLREPYGQPEIGSRFIELLDKQTEFRRKSALFGNECWDYYGTEVVRWNVHYTEVESVNLYANGVVSTTYPVTQGCDPVNGKVEGQENFVRSGRVRPQWLTVNGR